MTLIKSISGIRGTIGGAVDQGLTPIDAVKFAAAYGTWLQQQYPGQRLKVVIGRDARISGPMIGVRKKTRRYRSDIIQPETNEY